MSQLTGDLISREDTLTAFSDYVGSGMSMNDFGALWDIVAKMPPVNPKQTEITLESAIDYLHSISWLQKHDKELTEGVKRESKTDVLDKIIDEVCDIDDEIVLNPDSLFERKAYVRAIKVIDIIDKYKAESEDKE